MESKNFLKIGSINVRDTIAPYMYVNKAIQLDYDILLLSDTNKNRSLTHNGVITYNEHQSVATLILNKHIKSKLFYANSHLVTIKLNRPSLFITNYYIRPSNNEDTLEHLTKLKDIINRATHQLIMGDLNAHHESLGDKNNARGEEMFSLLVDHGWALLNDSNETTYTGTRGDVSSTDWACITGNLAHFCKWYIDTSFDGMSDHRLMTVEYHLTTPLLSANTKVVVKPQKFLKKIHSLTADGNVEDWSLHYEQAVLFAEKEVKNKHQDNIWSPELDAERDKIRELISTIKRRRYIEHPSYISSLKHQLQALVKLHKLNVHAARIQARLKLLQNTNVTNVFSNVTAALKSRNRHHVSTITVGDNLVTDSNIVANTILDRFYAGSEVVDSFDNLHSSAEADPSITEFEIHRALHSFQRGKAPGHDRVNAELLCLWFKSDKAYWVKLLNYWFANCNFPDQFKTSLIVPIIKNPIIGNNINNIRPIGLLTTLSKTYEKIISHRLRHFCETSRYFGNEQHGFRPRLGTLTALHAIQAERVHNQAGRHELIVSLDIKGAFDNVLHSSIIKALISAGCSSNLVEIMKSYFTNRQALIKIRDSTVTRPMKRGVIQGGSISPPLFVITLEQALRKIRSAINTVTSAKITMVVYADDINFVISSTEGLARPIQLAQQLFMVANRALADLGLSLSPAKTQLLLTNHENVAMKIKLGEDVVSFKNHIRILGVTFSFDRTFVQHVSTVITKARIKLKQLTPTLRTKHGLSREAKCILVTAIIYPTVTYAAHVWFREDSTFRKISNFNRELVISSTNSYRTISKASTLAVSPVIPLQYSAKRVHDMFYARRKKTFNQILIEKTPSITQYQYPPLQCPFEITHRVTDTDRYEFTTQGHAIFTDGSRADSSVGAAYAVLKDGSLIHQKLIKLPPHCSVFQAELTAIDAALDTVGQFDHDCTKIFSDSLSGLLAICNPATTTSLALHIHKRIVSLNASGHRVQLNWIKAHIGLQGNEYADSLANAARVSGELGFVPLPFSLIRKKITKKVKTKLNDEYRNEVWGRTIKLFVPDLLNNWNKKLILNDQTILLYTGHLPTRQFLHERKKVDSPLCSCGQIQTLIHLITTCVDQATHNIHHARKAKLPLSALLGPTNDFAIHPKVHRYIVLRAPSLIAGLIQSAATLTTQTEVIPPLTMLHISTANEVTNRNQQLFIRFNDIIDENHETYNWLPPLNNITRIQVVEEENSPPPKRHRSIQPMLITRSMDDLPALEQARKRPCLPRRCGNQEAQLLREYHRFFLLDGDRISFVDGLQSHPDLTWRPARRTTVPSNADDSLLFARPDLNSLLSVAHDGSFE